MSKKKRNKKDIHHRKTKSKGGTDSFENTIYVNANKHRLWHQIFSNYDPIAVAYILTHIFHLNNKKVYFFCQNKMTEDSVLDSQIELKPITLRSIKKRQSLFIELFGGLNNKEVVKQVNEVWIPSWCNIYYVHEANLPIYKILGDHDSTMINNWWRHQYRNIK